MKPIGSLLTGQRLKIAELQDYIIDIIYDHFQPDALLYGGTAIWRCFGGMRFSEDIDIYMDTGPFNRFVSAFEDYNLDLVWRDPEFPTRIRVAGMETDLILETKCGYAENEMRTYSRVDGTTKTISVLSPTELMIRKIEAYGGRRYIRDIYDLFILTGWLEKSDFLVKSKLSSFLTEIHKPVDEKVLSSLLYEGRMDLNFDQMIEYLKRWVNEI
jgi:predicted nucleotidyltransferase component of viral defense system